MRDTIAHNMHVTVCLLAAGVLVAGCSEASRPARQPEPVSTPRRAPVPVIDMRPITILFEGRPIAKLLADGRLESVAEGGPGDSLKPGPTLRSDGTIIFNKGGFTARVEPSGAIYVVSPAGAVPRERLFGQITGNYLSIGTSEGNKGIRVDGAALAFDEPPHGLIGTIEGAVDDGLRRTALVMTAAYFIDMSIIAR